VFDPAERIFSEPFIQHLKRCWIHPRRRLRGIREKCWIDRNLPYKKQKCQGIFSFGESKKKKLGRRFF